MTAELESWIVSVIGAPAAGKSFYLGALTHTLRRCLPARFRVSFTDSDVSLNRMINHYEQSIFGNPNSGQLTPLGGLIAKTQEQGDWYNVVQSASGPVQYPQPFMFTIRPESSHPHLDDPASSARVLCLYDNAGESYLAGSDSSISPVTRHLAQASLLLFLFDPTQDHDFRRRYLERDGALPADNRVVLRPQQTILTEAANRVRQLTNLPITKKHQRPFFVVVTKQDLWGHSVRAIAEAEPLLLAAPAGIACVNLDRIKSVSAGIRKMLLKFCPAVVDAAENFAEEVIYIGVSSLGKTPERDASGQWAIRPHDIDPVDVETPILFGLNKLLPGFTTVRLNSSQMAGAIVFSRTF